jgi:hypothetical protein
MKNKILNIIGNPPKQQKIKELKKHLAEDEFNSIIKYPELSLTANVYCIINEETPYCECGRLKTFYSFNKGFSKSCQNYKECEFAYNLRYKTSKKKTKKDEIQEIKNLKEKVYKIVDNPPNTKKFRFIKQFLNEDELKEVIKYPDLSLSENIYCYLNNETPYCKCGRYKSFYKYEDGFNKTCGKFGECKYAKKEFHDNYKKSLMKKFNYPKTIEEKIKNFFKISSIKSLQELKLILTEDEEKEIMKHPDLGFLENLYVYINKINPYCECGRKRRFLSFEKGFMETCGDTKHCKFAREIRNKKFKETNIKKYGVDNFSKSIESKEYKFETFKNTMNNKDDFNETFIRENFIKDGLFLASECENYFNINRQAVNSYKEKFNIKIPNKINKYKTQQEIYDFILSLTDEEILYNDRNIISPLELDIVIPKFKLAIEYDGLMFHSYGISKHSMFNNINEINKNVHLEKTELCEERGYHLFHIFEDEWLNPIKKDIWKSKIAIKLHSDKVKRISARKCIIKEINNKEAQYFLDENHLQGSMSSKYRYGLYYKKELVAVMTFGQNRFKKNEMELHRFASKKYTLVQGGFSKLLKHFINNNKVNMLISYGNRRWTFSKNNVYSKFFKIDNVTQPNYFYFKEDDVVLYNRMKFQKHKLKSLLENFDESKSELQNMIQNNYRIIYDCGNIKFRYEI